MNELYKIILNLLEIAKANNMFLASLEKRIESIEKSLTFELPELPSASAVPGAEADGETGDGTKTITEP